MGSIQKKMLLSTLLISLSVFRAGANPYQEYHTFTDVSGRSIKAVVMSYDADSAKVDLKMGNGKKGTVALDQLSKEDHDYLDLWKEAQRLLSNDLLEIDVSLEKGYWDDTGDSTGDRDRREDLLYISIVNHSGTTLTNITAEYCTYRERKEQTAVYNTTLELNDLTPSVPFETECKQVSYKRGFEFRNILLGARFRFMMPLSDGSVLVREICVPKALPLDK